MRTIIIDPTAQTVTERETIVDCDLASLIDCDYIERVSLGKSDRVDIGMYVNEEGLLHIEPSTNFFVLKTPQGKAANLTAGKAVIVATDRNGETVDLPPGVTVNSIRAIVGLVPPEKSQEAAGLAEELLDSGGLITSQEELDEMKRKFENIHKRALEIAI